MKYFFALLLITFTLSKGYAKKHKLSGIWIEQKRMLANGEDGSQYTFDGKPFKTDMQFNFTDDTVICVNGNFQQKRILEVNGDTLSTVFEYKIGEKINRLTSRYIIEKYGADEMVLKDFKPALDSKKYLIRRYIFKKADKLELKEEKKKEDDVYTVVEEMPSFPGGIDSMKAFIVRNVEFPLTLKNEGVTGVVYMQLNIGADGVIYNADIAVNPRLEFAKEAMRVMKLMPAWIPGKQKGKTVKVVMNIPIRFNLN